MVSARRKYEWPAARVPRTTRSTSPSGDSLARVLCRAPREPPSGFSLSTPARPSTRVDLPDPFSPTRNVTPAGMFRPLLQHGLHGGDPRPPRGAVDLGRRVEIDPAYRSDVL